jgi:excisionase family DNA binding protein
MPRRSNISEGERQRHTWQRAMSIRSFCEIYGVGRTTTYSEIQSGRLKARKVRGRTLIGYDAAEEWWHSLPELHEALDGAGS